MESICTGQPLWGEGRGLAHWGLDFTPRGPLRTQASTSGPCGCSSLRCRRKRPTGSTPSPSVPQRSTMRSSGEWPSDEGPSDGGLRWELNVVTGPRGFTVSRPLPCTSRREGGGPTEPSWDTQTKALLSLSECPHPACRLHWVVKSESGVLGNPASRGSVQHGGWSYHHPRTFGEHSCLCPLAN